MRHSDDLPDALDHLPAFLGLMDRRPALILDFDGTLSPIVEEPDAAAPLAGVIPLLERLAREGPVALISGRSLDDLRKRVAIEGLALGGSHGFELCTRGGERLHPYPESAAQLVEPARALERLARTVPGAEVENKRFALALHLRAVVDPVDLRRAEAAARALAAAYGLRTTRGRGVFELHPSIDWHKGRAVEWFLERWADDGFRGPVVGIGDDQTDEDIFRALRNRGIPVVVRPVPPRPTAARWRVDNPVEVRRLLREMADAFEEIGVGDTR